MIRHCTHHCRSCDGCFTSLAAFDGHRDSGACAFPDDVDFVEQEGSCKISRYDATSGNPIPRVVTVHALAMTEDQRRGLAALRDARGAAA